ncbi:F-box protein CPR1-like [Apium graveolens]|uniref:F-box protein CPR1-like n=1 Tax=Apium graveolens TaxID=4045 RepID=UPI003D793343
MGFSRSGDDYKVVRVVYVRDKMLNFWGDVAPKAEVYSLKKNTWKKIKDPGVPRLGANTGVYVNGSFYWLEMKRPSTQVMGRPYNSTDLWMLSFDFDGEVFGEVKIPKKVSNCLGVGARFKLLEFEGSLALCVFDVQHSTGVTLHPSCVWLMRQENGVVSWNLLFRAELKDAGYPMKITKAGTLLVETYPLRGRFDVTSILSCNLKTMQYKDLGFGMSGGVEGSLLMPEACTANASFTESLVMYEGGKALSKFSK